MDPIEALLALVVRPGGACAIAALLGFAIARRQPRLRDAILALGIAGGFVAALHALDVRPRFPLAPSEDAWTWVVWIAPAAAVLGIVETSVRAPLAVRVVARAACGFGAAWLLLAPFRASLTDETALEWMAISAVASTTLWTVLADASPRPSRLSLVIPPALVLAASGAILALLAHFALAGEAAGALGVCVGATAVFGWLRRDAPLLPAAAAPVVALVFVGLLVSTLVAVNYGSVVRFPLVSAVLLVAGVAAAAAKGWKTALVLALLAAGAAGWFAHVREAAAVADSSGW